MAKVLVHLRDTEAALFGNHVCVSVMGDGVQQLWNQMDGMISLCFINCRGVRLYMGKWLTWIKVLQEE